MKCTCQIEIEHYEGDDEECEMVFEKSLTICKNHRACCECGIRLLPGTSYRKEIVRYDESVSTYRTCMDCLSIRNNIFCGWTWTCLLDDLYAEIEEGRDISESCMTALTKTAREKACEMIEERWRKTQNL